MTRFIFILSILLFSCNGTPSDVPTEEIESTSFTSVSNMEEESIPVEIPDFTFGYDLKQPTKSFVLPKSLQEISGISMTKDFNQIAAVQDEKGLIFLLNKETAVIEKEIKFHKAGDYEGIELIGDNAYVMKSTGTLYEVTNFKSKKPVVTEHKYLISKSFDIEGLAHDAKHNRLLVACKENKEGTDQSKFHKRIYSFDLDKKTFDSTPVFNISLDQFRIFLDKYNGIQNFKKINAFFDAEGKKLALAPSALAIHPLTGNLYLSSSIGKLLIVLDPNGQLLHISKLSKKIFRQPEGICFDKDGTLFVASEGKGGDAKIQQFQYMN